MATVPTASMILAELRSLARPRRKPRADLVPSLSRLIGICRLTQVEARAGGVALRLAGESERHEVFQITCVVSDPRAVRLSVAERAIADLICEGRTRAQIARLRGVTANTVKSQVRQLFRKLNVDSRVALVRRWCP